MSTNPHNHPAPGSYREVWTLAYPAILTNVSQTIMWTVDSAMVGHVGKVELAAVGLGGILVWTIYSFFVGMSMSVNTFVSQYYGAGKLKKCGENLWQGLYIALAAGMLIYIIRFFNPMIVNWLGPAEDVRQHTIAYTNIRMLSAPFAMMYFTYSSFFRGIGNTMTPMKVTIIANLVNIIGDYYLIFGKGPFPAMGPAGAAWATSLANLVSASIFVGIAFSKEYRVRFSLHRTFRPLFKEMEKLLRIGIPIAIHLFLDMGSFLIFSAYIGRIGTEALAANQIIIQILALSFMPCHGFAIAATTLVGQYIGAKSPHLAEKSGYRSLKLGIYYACFIGLVYVVFSEPLVRIFNSDPTVVHFGKKIILWAAVFQFFDAIQMVSSGALRGAGDTKAPMLLALCFAWFLFIPLAYVFGTVLEGGVIGAWGGATIYITVLGIFMFQRFRRGRWREITL